MKNLLSSFILILFFIGCSTDGANEPVIEVDAIYLNGDETVNYVYPATLPTLHVGDELIIRLQLDGNGKDLKSFLVMDKSEVTAITIQYEEEQVSSDPNFTNPKDGKLGFIDSIEETSIGIKAKVNAIKEEDTSIVFYVNTEKSAAKGNIDYTVGEKEEESEKENVE